MINLFDAFGGDTTTPVRYHKRIVGHYDDDNHWIAAGYEDPAVISVTPMPFGDRDAGIAGIELKAKTTGERTPAFMKFTGRTPMKVNDKVEVYGDTYKLLKELKHEASGFYIMIGATVEGE